MSISHGLGLAWVWYLGTSKSTPLGPALQSWPRRGGVGLLQAPVSTEGRFSPSQNLDQYISVNLWVMPVNPPEGCVISTLTGEAFLGSQEVGGQREEKI